MKNILIIPPFYPYPLLSGGHQAIFNGIAILKDVANVYVYVKTTESQYKRGEYRQIETILPFVHVLPNIDPASKHTIKWYWRVLMNKIRSTLGFKETAKEAIEMLKEQGLEVVMLTGDNTRTAEAIARTVGIDTVISEVLPDQKADVVKEYQSEGKVVGMVGDGINDAPALALADIGIAIGTGTEVAIEAADLTILGGELTLIPRAIHLSHKTIRNIKQNLFWAFAYNTIGIPVAALGFLAPWIAGAAMAFSSVSVVTNSLRLKRVKI